MKHFFIFLLFIINSFAVYAQDTLHVHQGQLDSLLLLIKEHSKTDTFRVSLLVNYAQLCFYDLDFLSGLKAVNDARSIAKKIDFLKGEGLYLKSMAVFHQRIQSEKVYIGHLAVYNEVKGNRILHQLTNFNIFGGITLPFGGRDLNIEKKISSLQEAQSYFTEQGDKETLANVQYALAIVLDRLDQDKAKYYRRSAQDLFHEFGYSYQELVIVMMDIRDFWQQGKDEEAQALEIKAANIYTKETNKFTKALSGSLLGRVYGYGDRTNLGLQYLFEAEELLKELDEKDLLKDVYLGIATIYEWYILDSEKALQYEQNELNLRKELDYYEGIQFAYLLNSTTLLSLNRIKEFPDAYKDYLKIGGAGRMIWFDAEVLWMKARLLQAQGKSRESQVVFKESMSTYLKNNDLKGGSTAAMDLAKSFQIDGDLKNALKFALIAYAWASQINHLSVQFPSADLLSQLYEASGQNAKSYEYLKQYKTLRDKNEMLSNASRRSELEIQAILKKRQREIDVLETESLLKEQENKTQRIWIISIAGALASLILLTSILVRNNRQKQKTNKILETTLSNLQATQAQLIHSEKMASLGELTAGIAHEIQNPLNFVNNFSEVNTELLEELREEVKKGDLKEIDTIATDIAENENKISHHGKRASDIVEGMLEHSRKGDGVKEPTDINALADEYLRLAYHGLRAKDKSFNADFKTDFDDSLPKVNVVPQDIGRVLLNLINNAFYAVDKKAKDGIEGYKPEVVVSTTKGEKSIEIRVNDNGLGIPSKIKDKIFQPFFTTKPTGQGTGLGLSLSYDIVKAHGGEIKMESAERQGTEFIILLPNNL